MQGLAHLDQEAPVGEPWDVRIDRDWRAIEYAPESFRKDRDFVLKLCKVSGYAFEFADEELQEDWKLVLQAARHSFGDALKWAPKELHRNRDLMLGCVEVSQEVMKLVSNKAYNDEEAKIKSTAGVFFCYRRGGKDGVPFPKGACNPTTGFQCESCLRFLDDPENCPLPQDRSFIKKALDKNWKVLKYADKELRAEKEIVLVAVKAGGFAIMFASEELQADREVALEAARQNWQVFQQLSRKLRADKEIADAAVRQDWHVIKLFAKELKANVDLARIAVKQSWQSFQFLPKELRGNRSLAKEAVQQDWRAYEYMAKELKEDKELAMIAVTQSGQALQLVADSLKADLDVAGVAIRQDWSALKYAAPNIKTDEAIVLGAVETNGFAIKHAAEDLKCREPLVAAAMAQQWPSLDVAVNPLFHEQDGLNFEFWKSFSLQSGIKGKLKPSVAIGV
mmetsp:Transcript_115975/g.368887  ORF Transcript_115975/g.368887 Transcript_115975/m.368887 type:complete len:451 (+) Transcript_115975:80-1432(+)